MIHDIAEQIGVPVLQMALSGRAAQRLRGATGREASTIAAFLHAAARRLVDPASEGDPIIYLVNDYRRGLWNGSLGRIDRVISTAGARAMACSLDGAEHDLLEEDFPHVDLAYAITVHKAQGSQFKRVIVPLVKTRLLDRTLIYTALTRGMEQVVFIGDRDTFDEAVTAPEFTTEYDAWEAAFELFRTRVVT